MVRSSPKRAGEGSSGLTCAISSRTRARRARREQGAGGASRGRPGLGGWPTARRGGALPSWAARSGCQRRHAKTRVWDERQVHTRRRALDRRDSWRRGHAHESPTGGLWLLSMRTESESPRYAISRATRGRAGRCRRRDLRAAPEARPPRSGSAVGCTMHVRLASVPVPPGRSTAKAVGLVHVSAQMSPAAHGLRARVTSRSVHVGPIAKAVAVRGSHRLVPHRRGARDRRAGRRLRVGRDGRVVGVGGLPRELDNRRTVADTRTEDPAAAAGDVMRTELRGS